MNYGLYRPAKSRIDLREDRFVALTSVLLDYLGTLEPAACPEYRIRQLADTKSSHLSVYWPQGGDFPVRWHIEVDESFS